MTVKSYPVYEAVEAGPQKGMATKLLFHYESMDTPRLGDTFNYLVAVGLTAPYFEDYQIKQVDALQGTRWQVVEVRRFCLDRTHSSPVFQISAIDGGIQIFVKRILTGGN